MNKRIFNLVLLFVLIFVPIKAVEAKDVEYLNVKIGKSYGVNGKVKISNSENLFIYDNNLTEVESINAKEIEVFLDNNGEILISDNLINNRIDKNIFIGNIKNNKIKVEKSNYYGLVSFRINNNKLDVVNYVNIEDYLKGVLPKEMSPSFPKEALKAQAIASRSFAIANMNKFKSKDYNLDDTTSSQVYRGIDVEDKRTNAAIEETRNLKVYYAGEIANTIFHATSGGFTESIDNAWGGKKIPYLSIIEDDYSNYNKSNNWTLKMDIEEFNKVINKTGENIGEVVGVNIIEYTSSGRAKTVEIKGVNGVKTITGSNFRNLLNNSKCKSTLFNVSLFNSNGVNTVGQMDQELANKLIITGKGYGHGVGMSQYGAVEMAKRGNNCLEILKYYYPGVEIK